jgi:hypothetical protein
MRMTHGWTVIALALVAGCRGPSTSGGTEAVPAGAPQLVVEASCREVGCPFDDDDVFLVVTLTNHGATPVQLPLAYLRKTGPVIRLVHPGTGAETFLRNNLADPALREHPTELLPGASASLDWVIHRSELEQLGTPIDVTVEITIACDIAVGGARRKFTGRAHLRFGGQGEQKGAGLEGPRIERSGAQ